MATAWSRVVGSWPRNCSSSAEAGGLRQPAELIDTELVDTELVDTERVVPVNWILLNGISFNGIPLGGEMTDWTRSVNDHIDFWEVLRSRRMCRDYLPDTVAGEDLDAVLASAFRGPSAGNTAGLDLIVLAGDETRRYWDITLAEPRRKNFRWPGLLSAPVLVIPYVDPVAYARRYSEPDKASTGLGEGPDRWPVPYWFIDGGAAVMAMLLAAEATGLGALFFGQFDHEMAIRDELGVPEGRRALGTFALGHPATDGRKPSASARTGRAEWSSFTHRGRW